MQTSIMGYLLMEFALACASHAEDAGKRPQIGILKDFVADFNTGTVINSPESFASENERSAGVSIPGIFLHPAGEGDAVLSFPAIEDLQCAEGEHIFLLFRIGMRDGIPWGARANTPNGARFSVAVNGEVAFQEDIAEPGWKARAIDLQAWLGRDVKIEFRTNAIDGNTNYDWCVFGQPLLVRFIGDKDYLKMPENTIGVAMAEILCGKPSTVRLTMGDVSERASLQPGKGWLPLHFSRIKEINFILEDGSAELVSIIAAPHRYNLEIQELSLSSPLVTARTPFNALLRLKSTGPGIYRDRGAVSVLWLSRRTIVLKVQQVNQLPIGEIAPGEERTIKWEGLLADSPGDWTLVGEIPGGKSRTLSFYVFPTEPSTSLRHTKHPEVSITPDKPIRATVSNEWSRLSFTDGYAIAEVWNGEVWQRAGSLYPLAEVAIRDKPLDFRAVSFESSGDSLILNAQAVSTDGLAFPVRITYTPEAVSPRIRMNFELTAPQDADLLAFYGPSVLAGDRAYGVRKDFAIFPGLEYLEGDEESSSTRDLAYPHSDRRVPAVHKIATPLMAAQAQDSLVALIWDANQEWAEGKKHPAARFLAPKFDSGYEHIHMSLFAPSVGDYVRENHYEAADRPYPMKRGEKLQLSACLVLDHKARYSKDSVVHGAHRGGLVLQAMLHWFDVYGFPEPSRQPRGWEVEKALCRDAYFNAVWSEDPPGWRHCRGWRPGPFVGHAVPLMLDLRAGVSQDVRKEIERRIRLVIESALREHGKHYLWSGAGCHIMMGELPFYYGYLAESLSDFRRSAYAHIAGRENGLWVWRPGDKEHAVLGISGDHTLGQASRPSMLALRAARFTGDPELIKQALDAMKQMERYEIPRGAQTWECPLYQPDILASAYAIRAYCEAYRITGDPEYLEHARYWGLTGLPFIYMWELEDRPTMLYNVISVIGSTFYTHSWLGLPVVWCGLVYAYGLLDLAEFDDSFDWRRVAQGIVNSTMWQQYADGQSKGCYPDSWNMVANRPNPADINPENILASEFRLRGMSPEIRFARFAQEGGFAFLNSAADIIDPAGNVSEGVVRFSLRGVPDFAVCSVLAPVPVPGRVQGAGKRVTNSDELQSTENGWFYDADLRAVIIKNRLTREDVSCEVYW